MASSDTKNKTRRVGRKLSKNSKIFKAVIEAIQNKKGEHILSIDLKKLPEAVSDYFVLCDANSGLQVKAIADHVEEVVFDKVEEEPFRKEGFSNLKWVILDYVNIVVHIFQSEEREFYNLEEMWQDGMQEKH